MAEQRLAQKNEVSDLFWHGTSKVSWPDLVYACLARMGKGRAIPTGARNRDRTKRSDSLTQPASKTNRFFRVETLGSDPKMPLDGVEFPGRQNI